MADLLMISIVLALASSSAASVYHYDVVVYDATSGGVISAVSAARHGLQVALLCASWPACFSPGGERIGGMSSGGLGQSDIGNHPSIIGGLAKEFYQRNRRSYGTDVSLHGDGSCRLPEAGCDVTYNLEPSRAEKIFQSMLREVGVEVFFGVQASTVSKAGSSIQFLNTTSSGTFFGKVFIDASYEGDLFARAGVSYIVGREAKHVYNESLAGLQSALSNQFNLVVDPFDAFGDPLPLTQLPQPDMVVGGGDKRVQSYNFRLCVTQNRSNLVPFPKPAGYSATRFELLRRYIIQCEGQYRTINNGDINSNTSPNASLAARHCQIGFPSCNTAPVPGNKYDSNNCGGISSDFIGGSWAYPEASYDDREKIWWEHVNYQMGVMWTMGNDPRIPASVREEMRTWGLCKDEFTDNELAPHWPPSLYVREARRLQGDKVFTQNTPAELAKHGVGNESIGLGAYNFDSHNAQRLACHNKSACYNTTGPAGANISAPFSWDEGDVQIAPGVYQIPVWVMMPRKSEITNLLVVAAPTASHIGMSTLRMEPQFMIMGHAAGVVASLAINASSPATPEAHVQDVDTAMLRQVLLEEGANLDRSY